MSAKKPTDVLAKAIEELTKSEADPDLIVALRDYYMQQAAVEATLSGDQSNDALPVFLVTIARDVLAIPPMGGESTSYTVTKTAAVILQQDEQQVLKGIPSDIKPEDLLPSDQGLRVYGNWKIIDVVDPGEENEEGNDS